MKKTMITLFAAMSLTGAVAAGPLRQVLETDRMPENCRLIGEVKVGDIAWGKTRDDVVAGLKKEAADLGGNYLMMDIKRVNHPKSGVYYWGWGTVGHCK